MKLTPEEARRLYVLYVQQDVSAVEAVMRLSIPISPSSVTKYVERFERVFGNRLTSGFQWKGFVPDAWPHAKEDKDA